MMIIKFLLDVSTLSRLPRGFANIIYSNCRVTVTLQLLKMTLESVETSSKSVIIIINFISKFRGETIGLETRYCQQAEFLEKQFCFALRQPQYI